MAQTQSSGGNGSAIPWLAFLVGALVVVVAVIGFAMYSGNAPEPKGIEINMPAPSMPDIKLPDAPKMPTG